MNFKSKHSLTAGLFLFVVLWAGVVNGQSIWTGAGSTDEFHATDNWNTGVPGISDHATFDLPGNYFVDINLPAEVAELEVYAGSPEFIGGQPLTISERLAITEDASLEISSGIMLTVDRLLVGDDLGNGSEFIIRGGATGAVNTAQISSQMLIRDAIVAGLEIHISPSDGEEALLQVDNNSVVLVDEIHIEAETDESANLIFQDATAILNLLSISGSSEVLANSSGILSPLIMTETSRLELDSSSVISNSPMVLGASISDSPNLRIAGTTLLECSVINLFESSPTIDIPGRVTADELVLGVNSIINLSSGGFIGADRVHTAGYIYMDSAATIGSDVRLFPTANLILERNAVASVIGDFVSEGYIEVPTNSSLFLDAGTFEPHTPIYGGGNLLLSTNTMPGGEEIASIEMDNSVFLSNDSNIHFQINSHTDGGYDRLQVSQSLELDGQLSLEVNAGLLVGDTFTLFDVGSGSLSGSFPTIPSGSTFNPPSGGEVTLFYPAGDGNDVVLLVTQNNYLPGDVNMDAIVDLLDVTPFVDRVVDSVYQLEADINRDEHVDLLDIEPFVLILTGN